MNKQFPEAEERLEELREAGLLGPYDRPGALEKRLISAGEAPETVFRQEPLWLLRGLRLAAELEFDLDMDSLEAMRDNAGLLAELTAAELRKEFEGLISAPAAGRGLRMAAAAAVMPFIAGEAWPPKKKQDNGDIEGLAEGIHLCRPEPLLRMGLFLLCFPREEGAAIISRLNYQGEEKRKLRAAVLLLSTFHFTETKYDIKRFILNYGIEVYEYLTALAVQQRKVYDLPEFRTRSRHYVMEEIKQYKEAVFLEDLAVTEEDLRISGVADGEAAVEIRKMLLDIVHKYPRRNTREQLLKEAAELKNPLKAKTRNIRWIK
ncbi:MAG: hypothetical protein Q4C22_06485 [Bacillota bacterium]|nr:hypothetical protein [Bacillota bacterium]